MKIPATNPAPRANWGRLWPWLLLLATLVLVVTIRVRLLGVPLERDEGEYAYAGQLILQGIPPYEQAYNMKLPGTYYAYAIGMAVFGQNTTGVHLTLLAANGLTCVFLFLLGRALAGPVAGAAAGAIYALMSLSPAVLGLAAHATQFVVLFAVPGVWLLWKGLEGGDRRRLFFSGLLFGLAFLMKQHGFCFGLFGAGMLFSEAIRTKALGSRAFAGRIGLFGAGWALPFGIFCLCAWVAGDFPKFWFWVFTYAGAYVTEHSVGNGLTMAGRRLAEQLPLFWGFWLLMLGGLAAGRLGAAKRRALIFVLALLGCSVLGMAPGFYFRSHYFVLMLPAAALMCGLGGEALAARLAPRGLAWLAPAALGAAAAWNVYATGGIYFQSSPEQVCRVVYADNPFRQTAAVAQFIQKHSTPESKVAVAGSEPELFFYAGRKSATGYIYTYPLMENQPYALEMQQQMIQEIEGARPEFIVLVAYRLSWLGKKWSDPTIFREMGAYTRRYYTPVTAMGEDAPDNFAALFGLSTNDFSGPLREAMIVYQRKAETE